MKKTSNAFYLGYGLLIGAALAALGIIAVSAFRWDDIAGAMALPESSEISSSLSQPTFAPVFQPIVFPSATYAPTPTFTPTPTYTVFNPTPTPVIFDPPAIILTASPTLSPAEQKILSGEMAIIGPLTEAEQMALYNASIRFIALTTAESQQVGEQFAGDGYGSPTLICGPLSIHILQTAGLLSYENLVPLDFWLLNPFLPKDRALVNRTFLPAEYEHHEIRVSIRNITFSTFPLYPGDFLYIKHGSGGTFDHMLVVNRVDQLGGAYAVTNYNTDQGHIINEVMLYDPNDRSAGMFMQWTARRNAIEGATGFGGFELWRKRIP